MVLCLVTKEVKPTAYALMSPLWTPASDLHTFFCAFSLPASSTKDRSPLGLCGKGRLVGCFPNLVPSASVNGLPVLKVCHSRGIYTALP